MSNAKISKLKNGITIITDKMEGTGTFSLGFSLILELFVKQSTKQVYHIL